MTDEEFYKRVKNLLLILPSGRPYAIGFLTFIYKDENTIRIAAESKTINLKDISREAALLELVEIKNSYAEIINNSKELSDFIGNKEIEYRLLYNYGMGSVDICEEVNGKVNWGVGLL